MTSSEENNLRGELKSPADEELKQEARDDPQRVIKQFNYLYHQYLQDQTWRDTRWAGRDALKPPTDLWTLQEIIDERTPDYVVESGTYEGGTAHFLATVCETVGNGEVITVDTEDRSPPKHDRLTQVIGDSLDMSTVSAVESEIPTGADVMVILDSDHHQDHVSRELRRYAPLVTKGQYLLVEDTIHDTPGQGFRPEGPRTVVQAFLDSELGDPFEVDEYRERFLLTFSPGGFLEHRGAGQDEDN